MLEGASPWFSDEPGRNEAEATFLAHLRHEAEAWDVARLTPEDTSAECFLIPVYAGVTVPGLTIDVRTLQIAYWTSLPCGAVLHGAWSRASYILDDHDGNDFEDLTVAGVHADPQQHAAWAAAWILPQLGRPIVRQDWLRNDEVVASTWRFADTGRVLHRGGRSSRRLLRRGPDEVTRVR